MLEKIEVPYSFDSIIELAISNFGKFARLIRCNLNFSLFGYATVC